MKKSDTFTGFIDENRMIIDIPFNITCGKDAQNLLKFVDNIPSLHNFKEILENLIEEEMIKFPKDIHYEICSNGKKCASMIKEFLTGKIRNPRVQCEVTWIKNLIRVKVWTDSVSEFAKRKLRARFNSIQIESIAAGIADKIIKQSEEFYQFTFTNRMIEEIPFRITCGEDAKKFLGYLNQSAFLKPVREFLENVASEKTIELSKNIDDFISCIGQDCAKHIKTRFQACLIFRQGGSCSVDWTGNSVRVEIWCGSTPS